MTKFRAIGLTFAQIGLGTVLGLFGGLVGYYLVNNLIWKYFLANVVNNGLIVSLLQLLSFLAIYGFAVVCIGEGVRFIESLKHNKNSIPRSDFYRGAFMGAPAIIALLSITNIDWSSMSGIVFPFNIIFGIVYAIVFVLTIPIKIITYFIPIEILYVIVAPIGAVIGYKLSKFNKEVKGQRAEEAKGEKG